MVAWNCITKCGIFCVFSDQHSDGADAGASSAGAGITIGDWGLSHGWQTSMAAGQPYCHRYSTSLLPDGQTSLYSGVRLLTFYHLLS